VTISIDDYDAITRVLNLYIEGAAKGDVDKLRQAFHPEARMYGSGDTNELLESFFPLAAKYPANSKGTYRARIVSIEIVGEAAVATVCEDGFWGSASFVDFMALARLHGSWKIVNKTFAHTGGEMPAEVS
jgi:hypothetical protein